MKSTPLQHRVKEAPLGFAIALQFGALGFATAALIFGVLKLWELSTL